MWNVDPKPECELGYTDVQVRVILGDRYDEFLRWMRRGQTVGYCSGMKWNPETEEYVPACAGVVHGGVFYPHDVARFLDGLPVVD